MLSGIPETYDLYDTIQEHATQCDKASVWYTLDFMEPKHGHERGQYLSVFIKNGAVGKLGFSACQRHYFC